MLFMYASFLSIPWFAHIFSARWRAIVAIYTTHIIGALYGNLPSEIILVLYMQIIKNVNTLWFMPMFEYDFNCCAANYRSRCCWLPSGQCFLPCGTLLRRFRSAWCPLTQLIPSWFHGRLSFDLLALTSSVDGHGHGHGHCCFVDGPCSLIRWYRSMPLMTTWLK